MKTEADGWEPILEAEPSESFVCTYGGAFAQYLEINRKSIETFLDIASLGGRVLLRESKVRKPQALPDGINPDGSITGSGSLRWGQKIETEENKKKQNLYFQVDSDESGWVISINGDLIQSDLAKKGLGGREMARPFANKFEYYTRVGLREALLKDKFTYEGNKYLAGRFGATIAQLYFIYKAISEPGTYSSYLLGISTTGNAFANIVFHRGGKDMERMLEFVPKLFKMFDLPIRETIKFPLEVCGLALEVDRTLLADGYLDLQKYTDKNLVRVNPD